MHSGKVLIHKLLSVLINLVVNEEQEPSSKNDLIEVFDDDKNRIAKFFALRQQLSIKKDKPSLSLADFLSSDLNKFDNTEFLELSLNNQKKVLLQCLDKNHLYVNLTEIEDTTYNISDKDKKLNKAFSFFSLSRLFSRL